MPKIELPIATGFYVSRSLPIAAQQCVNWMPAAVQGPGLAKTALWGTPGLISVASSGEIANVNRGAHVKNGIPYFVNGQELFNLIRTFVGGVQILTLNALGTIPGTGRVSMADNGKQLCILVTGGTVAGGVDAFIFDEDAGVPFQAITDPDFPANGAPQHVVFIDGFFAFTTDSKKFIISALNDGLTYSALDFGTAEADPDDIVAPVVFNNILFISGSETIEEFQNIGGGGFPFQRVEGAVISTGVKAAFTFINGPDTVYFIGAGENELPTVRRLTQGGAEIVSTDAIDAILESHTDIEVAAAFAFKYSQNGGQFVGFTIGDFTLVYDASVGLWHERRSDVAITGDVRWRVNSMVQGYNFILVGDSQDGRIGAMDLDTVDEYDDEIIRIVATTPFSNQGDPFSVPSLELTVESGVGDFATIDPKIRLETSKDAKIFRDPITRSFGKIGEFTHRVIWRRLGRFSRFSVFRWTFSEKVKAVIIKLEANVVGGT